MKKKKPTKAQMENRVKNALVFVPRDKECKGVFFEDRSLRIEVTDDYAVVSTPYHTHTFNKLTSSGFSRPYMYLLKLVDIALECDCKTKNGYNFAKLLTVLEEKGGTNFNIVSFVNSWLFDITHPLFLIGEDAKDAFLVYEYFLHTIAVQDVLRSEKTEDMTNKQFVKALVDKLTEYANDLEEHVIFEKLTDEERMKQEMDAMAQNEQEQMMEGAK